MDLFIQMVRKTNKSIGFQLYETKSNIRLSLEGRGIPKDFARKEVIEVGPRQLLSFCRQLEENGNHRLRDLLNGDCTGLNLPLKYLFNYLQIIFEDDFDRVICKDIPEDTSQKINALNFVSGSGDVIVDFDAILTKYWIDGHRGQSVGSHGLLKQGKPKCDLKRQKL